MSNSKIDRSRKIDQTCLMGCLPWFGDTFKVTAAPVAPGGARRDRTDDLLLAKQALSQLSYGPAGGQSSVISCQEKIVLITDH